MRPAYIEKLWGGISIGLLPAKQRPGHIPARTSAVGESWEVADLPEGQSVVDDHPICRTFADMPLGAVVARHGLDLIGTAHPPGRFPILVKLIDAAEPLSVQVHPGADYAATHPGTFSKDEAWLIIDVNDGGCVLHGFVDGVSRELFVDAVKMGLPHELMRSVPVKRGDVLHVSPGVVHAIGAGVVILEVQEPSDTTFRVWDYNRTDASGKPRALHLASALEVARFGPQPPALTSPRVDGDGLTMLCDTRAFSMAALIVNGATPRRLPVPTTHALVLHAEGGDGVTLVHDGISLVLPRGASCVLPASCGEVEFPALGAEARVIVMR
jgi:mannose-6-phosphate isomerase